MLGKSKAVGKWLTVLSLCAAIGLHWAALQTVAWMGMLLDYSRTGTVASAIEKTFDGHHPCPLCQAISKGRESGKKPELQLGHKIDMDCDWQAISIAPPAVDNFWHAFVTKESGVAHEPGVPPPRVA